MLARIFTRTPREAQPLVESLREAGYKVEIAEPGQVFSKAADLEYVLDLDGTAPQAEMPATQTSAASSEPAIPHGYEYTGSTTPAWTEPAAAEESYVPSGDRRPFMTSAREALGGAIGEALQGSRDSLREGRERLGRVGQSVRSAATPIAAAASGAFARLSARASAAREKAREKWTNWQTAREEAREYQRRLDALQASYTLTGSSTAPIENHSAAEIVRNERPAQRTVDVAMSAPPLPAPVIELPQAAAPSAPVREIAMAGPVVPSPPAVEATPVRPAAPPAPGPVVVHRKDVRRPARRSAPVRPRRVETGRSREWKVAFGAAAGTAFAFILAAILLGPMLRHSASQLPQERVSSQAPAVSQGVTVAPPTPVAAGAPANAGGVTVSPGRGVTIAPRNMAPRRRVQRARFEEDEPEPEVRFYRRPAPRAGTVQQAGVRRYTDLDRE